MKQWPQLLLVEDSFLRERFVIPELFADQWVCLLYVAKGVVYFDFDNFLCVVINDCHVD
jgi:hypothetical protein